MLIICERDGATLDEAEGAIALISSLTSDSARGRCIPPIEVRRVRG